MIRWAIAGPTNTPGRKAWLCTVLMPMWVHAPEDMPPLGLFTCKTRREAQEACRQLGRGAPVRVEKKPGQTWRKA